MKNILSLFSFLFVYTFAFSQQQNFKITYRHCVQFDTTKSLRDTIGLEAILIGNSLESNYSYLKLPKQIVPQNSFEGHPLVNLSDVKQSGTYYSKTNGTLSDTIGNVVYQNKKNKLLYVREKMQHEYVITEEAIPAINWEITDETRIIKTYRCKMAVTYFRGRYYKAWFTTDVPIVAAPWKFGGLPGLVMDIEDDRQQVKIYVEKIEYPTDEKVNPFVNSGRKISLNTYFNFRNDDFKKLIQAQQAMLDNQEHMQEIIAAGGARPVATGIGAYYGIELRIN
jgi:GLPGLI family protein